MIRDYFSSWVDGWNRFWFTPADCFSLCVMRPLVGIMLFYTHLVWSKELMTFFSKDGVIPPEYLRNSVDNSPFAWSHFFWIDSPELIWTIHIIALIVFAMFTLGMFTRVTGILSFLITVSYANRAAGALFGLDQMNAFLVMYLAIAPCAVHLSFDSWRRRQRGLQPQPVSTWANLITRLIQVHLCVIYFFAGTGKLLGPAWWNGEAIWGAFASYEYQTMDFLWLVDYPFLIHLITLVSLAWEVSYAYLVWPKLTRPIMVTMGFFVHAGIGMAMGMLTFGYIMIVANFAFVSPGLLRRIFRFAGVSPLEESGCPPGKPSATK